MPMARHVDLLRAVLEDLEGEGLIQSPVVEASRPSFRAREWVFRFYSSEQRYEASLRRADTGEVSLHSGAYLWARWTDSRHTVWMPGVAAALRSTPPLARVAEGQRRLANDHEPDREPSRPPLDGHEFDRWAAEDESLIPKPEPQRAFDRLLADHDFDHSNQETSTP